MYRNLRWSLQRSQRRRRQKRSLRRCSAPLAPWLRRRRRRARSLKSCGQCRRRKICRRFSAAYWCVLAVGCAKRRLSLCPAGGRLLLSVCSSSPSLPSEVSARKWRLTEMLRPCVLVGRQDGDQDGGGSSSMGVHPDFVGTDPASRAPQQESKAYRGFRSRVDVSYDTSWVRLRRIGPIFCAEMRTLPPSRHLI